MQDLSERYRYLREYKDLGQLTLARELNKKGYLKGYTDEAARQRIRKIENGIPIDGDLLKAYSRFFDVSREYLIGQTDVPTKNKTVQQLADQTGLTDTAIEKIRSMDEETRLILNEFIENDLTNRLTDVVAMQYKSLSVLYDIKGNLPDAVEKAMKEYTYSKLLLDMYHTLTHTEKITNHFMRKEYAEMSEALANATDSQEFKDLIAAESKKQAHRNFYKEMTEQPKRQKKKTPQEPKPKTTTKKSPKNKG